MPHVELTVSVEIREGAGLSEIESAIHQELMATGRKALAKVLEALDAPAVAASGGARQRSTERYVLTRFGEIRFTRTKVLVAGHYRHPLDQAIGLGPHQSISSGLESECVRLAQMMSYRQAADVASALLGITIDHRRIWGRTQHAGRRVREATEAQRRRVFEDGELPELGDLHEMVVVQADETGIRLRDRSTTVAKLMICYAGKDITHPGGKGKRRRRAKLRAKTAYASLAEPDSFGQSAFVTAERSHGLSRARHRLAISDGAHWIRRMVPAWLGITDHQVDHFHLRLAIRRIVGDDDAAAIRWWRNLMDGRIDLIAAAANRGVAAGRFEAEAVREVLGYLRACAGRLHVARDLRRAGAPPELCDRGSGGIEHAIDLIIARRMKRKGMFWSTEGAENMLALRGLAVDPQRWKEAIGRGLAA